jgi:hypothetical protein
MSKTSNHAKLEALKGWLKTLKPRPKKIYQQPLWEIEDEDKPRRNKFF